MLVNRVLWSRDISVVQKSHKHLNSGEVTCSCFCFTRQVGGLLPCNIHPLGSRWAQQRQRGGAVCSDEPTSRYWTSLWWTVITLLIGWTLIYRGLVSQADGTMPTVVGLQVTSVRSSQETSTLLLHPLSPGRATALQVTHTLNINTHSFTHLTTWGSLLLCRLDAIQG